MIAGALRLSKLTGQNGSNIPEFLGFKYPQPHRLAVVCELNPPDRRIRDLDNPWKCLADAITQAGGWYDDSQIDDLRLIRREVIKGGSVTVNIKTLVGSHE
ncbi:crossover junction endodeoxyribonuclease RusA [Gammaproteobacteria bacterium]